MAKVTPITVALSSLNVWSRQGRRRDLIAIAFIVAVALCYLAPALTSGPSFGPADLGRGLSVLTSIAQSHVHNTINGDIIDQSVAWNTLNYTLIHHGQFPLWNTYAGNGLPEFLNFESAVLALPSLVGYLVPLSWSFTVIVFVKMLIAGLGTYWCARLLRLRPLPATFAGTTFMCSGAFSNWLGWSISGVLCWVGVIAAGAILCGRTRSDAAPIAVVAIAIAFAIYGGFPEGYVLMGLSLVGLFVLSMAIAWKMGRSINQRAILRFVTGSAIGCGLSAPLWLPGLAVIRASIRAGTDAAAGVPIHGILLALAQGYDGLPLSGSDFFLARTNYYESAAYIGVIALVLAGVALGTRVLARERTSPVVTALGIVGVIQLLVIYQVGTHAPVQHLVRLVGLGSIATHRLLPLLAFVVALLGAFGLDELLRHRLARRTLVALAVSVAFVAVVLAYMWIKVPEAASTSCAQPTTAGGAGLVAAACEAIRRSSLYGPTAIVVALAVAACALAWLGRKRITDRADAARLEMVATWSLGLFLVVQVGYLVFAGVNVNTYSRVNYPATTAAATLEKITAGTLVAQHGQNSTCPAVITGPCGLRLPTGILFYPNINIGYGVTELAMHDPIIPKASFADWPVPNAGQLIASTNLFNPDVSSVALARAYGVSYVLMAATTKAPSGMVKVTTLVNNGVSLDLYAVPKSGKVMAADGVRVTSITTPNDRQVVADLVGSNATTVAAHITDSPGWHAEIDGKSLPILRGPTNDLLIPIPASVLRTGRATLTLTYLPRDLVAGLILAVLCGMGLAGLFLFEWRNRRDRLSQAGAS